MSRRVARLNEQLRRELSDLIRTRIRDPRVGVVTVTGVEVAADLGSARVFVRISGPASEIEEALSGLEAAAPFLRGLLGRILKVRRVPELRFRLDRSFEHARRIEEVLGDVLPADSPPIEPKPGDEGEPRGDAAGLVERPSPDSDAE